MALVALGCVLGGCQVNMWALEELVSHPKGKDMGLFVTLCQCLFISIVGFLDSILVFFPGKERLKKSSPDRKKSGDGSGKQDEGGLQRDTVSDLPRVWLPFKSMPWLGVVERELSAKWVIAMGSLFALMSIVNNICYDYDVSVPFHTIFRSCSLTISVILGLLFFGKSYGWSQLLCAGIITAGVITFSFSQMKEESSASLSDEGQQESGNSNGGLTYNQAMGLFLLTVTSIAGPFLGLVQDRMYGEARSRLGNKQFWREASFYGHAVAAAVLLLAYGKEAITRWNNLDEELYRPLAFNIISQLICVRGVYALANNVSSFNVALALVVRKLVTMVFSLIYFGHWSKLTPVATLSMIAAFGGAIVYNFLPSPSSVAGASSSPEGKKKRE